MNALTRLRAAFALDSFRWFLGDLPDFPQPEPPGRWRLLAPEEATDWVRDHPGKRADQRRAQEVALQNHHLLFVASQDGRAVGHIWVGRGWTYSDWPDYMKVRLAPGTGYFYDMFIEKAHRRRGLAHEGFRFRLQTARQNGLRRYAAGVISGNRVGRDNSMAQGFPWWDALRLRVGGHAFWLKGRPWERIGDQVVTERV